MELARVNSKARVSRSHQVLKDGIVTLWIKFGSSQDEEKIFKRRLESRDCKFKIFILGKNVNDRLVMDYSSLYTHTQNF